MARQYRLKKIPRTTSAKEGYYLDAEKRPRQWAQEVVALPTREQRQQKLTEVPEHLRDFVKKHVEITFRVLNERNKQCTDKISSVSP